MRLLLAEDERALSRALVTILKLNHYSVDAVYDGASALDYLKSGLYDGAILDVMMPKMDGLTVLKEIRKENKALPILLLTAKTQIDDKVEGLDAGADDYLGKPFESKELLARVRAMLRRRGEASEPVLTFCDLTFDRNVNELSSPKGKIKLGGKEFQMLEMLMLKPGTVISAEKFMDKIWGYDAQADINVVWVYLSNLRKKISSLTDEVQIKSVRNLGYSIVKV